jgi:hypothetical protein
LISNLSGSAQSVAASTDSDYSGTVGMGGGAGQNGRNGLVVISWGGISDTTPPSAPGSISLGQNSNYRKSPTLTFADASDANGISGYQVQVYEQSNDSILLPWTTLQPGSRIAGTFTQGSTYYAKIRAIDRFGNIGSALSTSAPWTTPVCSHGSHSALQGSSTVSVDGACPITLMAWGAGGGGGFSA